MHPSAHQLYILPFILGALLLTGCGSGSTPFREVFKKQTPYEQYEQSLREAGLNKTALGQDWTAAGQKALRDSLRVTIPFRETGYFAADKPVAHSYQVHAQRGQRLVVKVDVQSRQSARVFVDIFELNGTPKSVAAADTAAFSVDYEVEQTGRYLIRVQPELLRSGRYTISITSAPVLGFPVAGKDDRSIGSFWGADRDGGRRSHEGIDIFAKRGTPVVAAAAGVIRGVNSNNLGGKVVWLSDGGRNQTLYYAHLDQQLVQEGQRVQPGDTLGLVGNTGNAATTQPHLHFGIYRFGEGAIDPYPFVRKASGNPTAVKVDTDRLGRWYRVTAKKVSLRTAPESRAVALRELAATTPFMLLGATGNWYRVALPGGETGYVPGSSVESVEEPIRKLAIRQLASILDFPDPVAPALDEAYPGNTLPVLAKSGTYLLVETPSGQLGWLSEE